jgi:hypothetical protein
MSQKPTLLVMPDGRTASIHGRSANISPEQATQLDLIRLSTTAIEPSGGRLVELIRCCMLGPGKETA